MNLSPLAVQKFFSNLGFPLVGGKLFTYAAGTTTKVASYQNQAGTLNSNPVILNFRGECNLWLDVTQTYKFVLAGPFDTDPPTNPIWTVDNIAPPIGVPDLTQQIIGFAFYPRNAVEIAALVVPTFFYYYYGDPKRYGALGDGITNDSAAMGRWAAVMNAGLGSCTWSRGTYLSDPITVLTQANMVIQGNGATLKSRTNSLTGSVNFLDWTGAGCKLYDLIIDGNQSAYSVAPSGSFLLQTGNDYYLNGVSCVNSPAYGFGPHNNLTAGKAIGCHFDNNASSGCEIAICSYLYFSDCTFDNNGYGLNGTFNLNGPQGGGFGLAIRLRSHHLSFVNCQSNRCGRDGMNVNQGSYAVKFTNCLCWMDNDGGFTTAADNTGTGLPGEGEAPRDIEYVNCEAYNNFTSGLASYNQVFNLRVVGGRFYNNHRCAGLIADATSFNNGIFVASSSVGVDIETTAYDDRQFCPVTAASGTSPRTVTATGWVAGSASNYPRVALYNSSQVFQGYGRISSESSGSVVIITESVNGVTLANIVNGWFITQRVQHCGVFYGNGCTGRAKVDGWGHKPSTVILGVAVQASAAANDQNVLVPDFPLYNTELLTNPTFDAGVANWTANASTLTAEATINISAGGAKLVGTGANAYMEAGLDANVLKLCTGPCFVEFSLWIRAVAPNDAALRFFWNCGSLQSTTISHPGGDVWRKMTISAFMSAVPTQIIARMEVVNGATVYADSGYMRVRGFPVNNNDFSYPTRNLPV